MARARSRVAGVPDRDFTVEAAQLLLGEDLRDEPEVAEHRQPSLIRDRDPGRLLAAVLECEEAEVADARHVALGRAVAEAAAHQRTPPSSRRPGKPSLSTFSGRQASTIEPNRASPSASVSMPLQSAASRRA